MRKFFAFLCLCTIVLGSLFSVNPVFAGTTIQLSPTTVAVKEGDVFDVTAMVIPPGVKSYTVRLVLEFPADLVNVKTWAYEPKWIPVRKPGYDVLNNDQGVFIRTAGYPDGFDSSLNFGKITFIAKKSGVASIRISNESLVFDKNSNNIATLGSPVSVKITASAVPKPEPVPAVTKTPSVPEVKSVKEEIVSPNFLASQKMSSSTENTSVTTSTTSTESLGSATSTKIIQNIQITPPVEPEEEVAPPVETKSDEKPAVSQNSESNVVTLSKSLLVGAVSGISIFLLLLILIIGYLIGRFSKRHEA